MKHDRIELAQGAGLMPALEGATAVFGQITAERLSFFDKTRLHCVSPSFVTNALLKEAGFSISAELEVPCAHALVLLPRAKAEALHLIAKAVQAAPNGWIIVDGQKTDGVESIAKLVKKHVPIEGMYSKAHGKTLWFKAETADALVKWHAGPSTQADGFVTAPGVFSADGVDPASRFLADHLPSDLSGAVADLGSGWGYLAARVLPHAPAITALHLVEDNSAGMACALQNVPDPRAVFHWADALSWKNDTGLDAVIMNPPFHTSRAADPELGKAFIQSAARLLKPGGMLFMVANAHLPYAPVLEQCFARVETLASTNRFVVTQAEAGRAKHR